MPHPDSKKRAISEIIDDELDAVVSKKPKVESDADPDQSSVLQVSKAKNQGKDGKKRRRRSKSKKQPVTVGASHVTRSMSMTLEPENDLPAQPEFVQGSSGASSSSISPRAATQPLTPVLAIKSEETQPSLSENANIAECTPDPKGKEPEQAPSPKQSATAVEATSIPKETHQKVQKQLTTTTETLGTHEALLNTLLPSLTCQVCLDLLYKPFALSPCGHIACYSCLVSWFTAPLPDQLIVAANPPNALFRKKTCPHCRAVVRDRPSEVWNVKDMVDGVVKSGLVRGMFPDPEPETVPTAEERARDPWANIFHKPSANANHNFGHVPLPPLMLLGQHINAGPHHGILPGHIPPLHEHPHGHHNEDAGREDPNLTGMYDREDDVWRCVDCMHEIWSGTCSRCHRVYPENEEYDPDEVDEDDDYDDEGVPFHGMLNAMFGAHDHAYDYHHLGPHDEEDEGIDEDEFGSIQGDEEGEGENDLDDDVEDFEARAEFDRDYRQQLHRQLPYIHDLFGVGEVDGDEDDGEGEEEGGSDGGYESSFIDDADARPADGERGVIEISSDSEDDLVREVRPRLGRRNAPIVVSDDEEEVPPPPPHPSSSRRRIVESDEDDDEEDGEHYYPRAGPSRQPVVYSDEEEEDYHSDGAGPNYEDDDGSIARPPIHLAHLLHNADSPIPDAREVAEGFAEQAGYYEDDEQRDDYEDEGPRTDYEDEDADVDVDGYGDAEAYAMGGGYAAEVYPDEHGYDDYYGEGDEGGTEHGGYEYGMDDGYGDYEHEY